MREIVIAAWCGFTVGAWVGAGIVMWEWRRRYYLMINPPLTAAQKAIVASIAEEVNSKLTKSGTPVEGQSRT